MVPALTGNPFRGLFLVQPGMDVVSDGGNGGLEPLEIPVRPELDHTMAIGAADSLERKGALDTIKKAINKTVSPDP